MDDLIDTNASLKAAMQARVSQIREDARESGWTLDKEAEVFRISSAWALIASGRGASSTGQVAIVPPRDEIELEQRALECEQALDLALRDVVDRAQVLGWKTPEVLDAIERIAQKQRTAYAEDSDPADDPPEPA